MADKPNMRQAWANQGTAVPPATDKIDEGWVAEKPPFENENWLQNRSDVWMQSTEERGVPEWDSSVPYNVYALCWHNNMVWRALQAHTNIEPGGTTPGYWIEVDYDAYLLTSKTSRRAVRQLADNTDLSTIIISGFYSRYTTATDVQDIVYVAAMQNGEVVSQFMHTENGRLQVRTRFMNNGTPEWTNWEEVSFKTYVDNADTTITNGYQNADAQIRSDFTSADTEIYRYLENGMDRTWQDVTSQRDFGTVYTNTTGVTITVLISASVGDNQAAIASVDGVAITNLTAGSSAKVVSITFDVPPGSSYTVNSTVKLLWTELRPTAAALARREQLLLALSGEDTTEFPYYKRKKLTKKRSSKKKGK